MTSAFRVLSSGAVLTALVYAYTADFVVIGLLGALPLVARGAHLFAPWLVARFGAVRVTHTAAIFERVGYLGAAGAGITGAPGVVPWLLGGLAVGAISGAVYDLGITALAAEMVRTGERGSFFAVRTRWLSAFSVLAGLFGGLLVDAAESNGIAPITARGATMLAGIVPALLAIQALRRLELQRVGALAERAARRARGLTASMQLSAIPGGLDPAVRAALIFAGAWGISTGLIVRHIDVFALSYLGFSVGTLTIITGLVGGAGFLWATTWGRLGDHFGARPIVIVAAALVAMNPLWYALATPQHTLPFWFGQILGGIANAGWVIGIPLLLLRSPSGGMRALALFHATVGVTSGVAPLLGGVLLQQLAPFGERFAYVVLFGASFLLRLGALALLTRVPHADGSRTRHMLRVIWRGQRQLGFRVSPRTPAGFP